MILDKWKERRHVENIRSSLKGMILGFITSIVVGIAIGFDTQGSITIGSFIVLFLANRYFSSIRALERKYKNAMIDNAYWMRTTLGKLNTDDIFMMHKYDEIKRLGLTILNDTEISKDGYYKTIFFVFVLIPVFTIYNIYKFMTHQLPGYVYGSMMIVLAAIFIGLILDIKAIEKTKNATKDFIIKEGWDKKWGR